MTASHARRNRVVSLLAALVVSAGACKPERRTTPPPAYSPAAEVALSGASILIGAGDIGACGSSGDEATANLVDSVLKADSVDKVRAGVVTFGDNAYPAGLDRDFVRCFGSSWGDPRKRILRDIHPAIGNHDFQSTRGAAYYRYFGARAGAPFKGYYSYDIGDWHAIALNSELVFAGTPEQVASQEAWLSNDIRTHDNLCTVAYFHRPLFSSGAHGPSVAMRRIWQILSDGKVDLVLNGHEHHYERFLPQTPSGVKDTVNGIEEIIVGTGGGPLTGLRSPSAANSAAQIQGHWGVLIAALGKDEYRTAFIDDVGRVWDPAGRKCH